MLEDVFVEATGTNYHKGQTYEVSNALADRHIGTGFMEEVKPKSAPKAKVDKAPDPEPVKEPIKAFSGII